VRLLRQGDINIVLNAEPYSFAHNFFEAHGPSLCATALRVKDGQAALHRATAYRGQPFRGLVGPNERESRRCARRMAACCTWSSPRARPEHLRHRLPPGAGRQRQWRPAAHRPHGPGLPAEALDSWVLFYKSLFDFTADDEVVLPDPYGLVKSRALRSRGTLRLPLNISENRNTAIAHALSAIAARACITSPSTATTSSAKWRGPRRPGCRCWKSR
jgi:4-hydroxyphenylpyruvate dioxygenase